MSTPAMFRRLAIAIAVFSVATFFRGGRLRDGQHALHHPLAAEPLHAERMGFGLRGGEPRPSRQALGRRPGTAFGIRCDIPLSTSAPM